MQGPTLADALARAGSAVKLLWKPNAPWPKVPVVPPEFAGWRQEQRAWEEGVVLFDLSHHMADLFIDGPDAVRLLSYTSANNYEKFVVGQAKQFIAVAPDGNLIQDAILIRLGENQFNMIGIGTTHNWVAYHAAAGGYDVRLTFDPPSDHRPGDPVQFRYQVQGPKAAVVLSRLFGTQLDDIRFFHFKPVMLGGRSLFALRHGMAGQAGFEFFGDWQDGQLVRDALLDAGVAEGMIQVGGRAYYTVGVDSGWMATPIPAIYTDPALEDFRKSVSLYSYEGMNSIQGSFYSPSIEDYYRSPYELGYGRSISFGHDFVGRDALAASRDKVRRTKVTLVWDARDVKRVFGADHDLIHTYTKDRIEVGGELIGVSEYAAYMDPAGTVHSLAVIDTAQAQPGAEVTLLWGQHPGPDAGADYREDFHRIKAVVQPAPYYDYARTAYRAA